jgi:hypothetical protein
MRIDRWGGPTALGLGGMLTTSSYINLNEILHKDSPADLCEHGRELSGSK